MTVDPFDETVSLDVTAPIWDQFFLVHNLVVIGSHQAGGEHDLAPKHMAMPLGWENYFGFVCTPKHRTYLNIKQEREFTVSFPRPSQVVEASLTAAPRCNDDSKPTLQTLPTFQAKTVDALFLSDSYLYLECQLHRIVDGFGENSLITGQITGAYVHQDSMRARERDDGDLLYESPLLAYVSPGRFAHISDTKGFPFPEHYKR
jgi:flavin reductase (DIM6/NTAB) family NADH-FMN oxidoreductase RutF